MAATSLPIPKKMPPVFVILVCTCLVLCAFSWLVLGTLVPGLLLSFMLVLLLAAALLYLFRFPPFHTVHTASIADERFPRIKGHAVELWGSKINDPHMDFQLAFDKLVIRARDEMGEFVLRGWHIPPLDKARKNGATCLLMVHGAGRDRRAFLRHTPALHTLGYGLVLADLREHGLSDRDHRGMTYGPREASDIEQLLHYCRTVLGYKRLAVIGTSTGASAALLVAAHERNRGLIDILVCENAFYSRRALMRDALVTILGPVPQFLVAPRKLFQKLVGVFADMVLPHVGQVYQRSPIQVASEVSCPVLFIHGTEDKTVPVDHSKRLFAAAREPKDLWIVNGAAHTAVYDACPDHWVDKVIGFVEADHPKKSVRPSKSS